MFELKILGDFSAAHQLRMVGEKCENLHGHNWKVEIYVRGEKLSPTGILVDFGILKAHMKSVLAELDHRFLNEMDAFSGDAASSERIAIYIANGMETRMDTPGVRVHRVSVWESDTSCASYYPVR